MAMREFSVRDIYASCYIEVDIFEKTWSEILYCDEEKFELDFSIYGGEYDEF